MDKDERFDAVVDIPNVVTTVEVSARLEKSGDSHLQVPLTCPELALVKEGGSYTLLILSITESVWIFFQCLNWCKMLLSLSKATAFKIGSGKWSGRRQGCGGDRAGHRGRVVRASGILLVLYPDVPAVSVWFLGV